MARNKIISAVILFLFASFIPVQAVSLKEVTSPMEHSNRFGTTDVPESRFNSGDEIDLSIPDINIKPVIAKEVKSETKTYADLSIKGISMEISKSIDLDYNDMLEDLSLLWQGAATKSDTIKFAVYKLSNPDKDKPDDGAIKKVLSTIAGMGTFIGAGSGNPILASAALIGGNTLGIMSQDNKALNYKYTRVTDADMIILVRKIDELQQKIVDAYYDYMTARYLFDLTSKMVKEKEITYRQSLSQKREVVLITDTYYRNAIDEQVKARGNFFEKRSQLEQLVGNDIFRQFEETVDKRTN